MFRLLKNLGIDPFPNSISHFETQWRPSCISYVSNTGFTPRFRHLSYRGAANLKIMIFVLDMLVIMLMDLENCKKQTGCFQSWQIEEEPIGKPPLEMSRIVQNLTNLSYRGGANLKKYNFSAQYFCLYANRTRKSQNPPGWVFLKLAN